MTPERERLVAAVERAALRRDTGLHEINAKAAIAYRALDDSIRRAENALAAYDAAHPEATP